ncbi:hypothetical protein [Flavobacterium nitrogenifigens]|uniref:Uncharacterized protein n=1 Tax=Flavobacterium nitrogenifigens TaxID=1617283 RepID=A0A521F8F5_9FLAO|nr:hypothetical protein [Flavobacterium nitrogenifigens]KAF2337833.1 hypothetical protein DM397_03905 [Flavobacterium nitrogenifigens]SMO92437.1 hypothetical protein SAMN06265220_10771 [Flavobacterium nitrogenifigens]
MENIIISESEKKEICKELKNGFTSFFHFSLKLIEDLSEENNNLKFAVVNMQISLELFLKYYFLMIDEPERVFTIKNRNRRFRDFSEVLKSYYSISGNNYYADKKNLISILESRNDIVHKGKYKKWDDDLANYIITCIFFIQGNFKNLTSETLLGTQYHPHKLSNNWTWKTGSSKFARKIADKFDDEPLECPHCYSRSLINKEIFEFDDQGEIENYQCLTCLCEVDTQIHGALIECCECNKKAYYVDKLNIQSDKTHLGACFNCGNKMDLRHCENCDKFYFHDLQEEENEFDENYFCSNDCVEVFKEDYDRLNKKNADTIENTNI